MTEPENDPSESESTSTPRAAAGQTELAGEAAPSDIAPARPERWPRDIRAAACALLIAGAVAYNGSYQGKFLFEDGPAIVANPGLARLFSAEAVWAPPGTALSGRPVASLSFALNYAVGELSAGGYHMLNLLIHLLAAFLLFGVVRRTLLIPLPVGEGRVRVVQDAPSSLRDHPLPEGEGFGRHATGIALAATLLWTIHPLQTESVAYVIGRVESLMGLFYLLTLYCAIRSFEEGARPRWKYAAIAACALGMGTKETMVTAPLMVLLYDRTLVAGSFRQALARRPMLYAALAATWVILAALLLAAPPLRGGGMGAPPSGWQYLLLQLGVIPTYLGLAFWPARLCGDYFNLQPWPPGGLALGGFVLAAAIAWTVWALARRRPAGLLGAWFLLILLPSSSLWPVDGQAASEQRMYLPLAALVLAVMLAAYDAGRRVLAGRAEGAGRRRVGIVTAIVAVAAVAGPLLLATMRRNQVYASEGAFWANVVRDHPENYRAQTSLALMLLQARKPDEALACLDRAVAEAPKYVEAYLAQGLVYEARRDAAKAAEAYDRALAVDPRCALAYVRLGVLLVATGQPSPAVAHFHAAVQLMPRDPGIHLVLANTLLGLKQFGGAVAEYAAVLRLAPGTVEAANAYGWILATCPDAAVRNPKEALRGAQYAVNLVTRSRAEPPPSLLDTLAAAYAANEQYDQAVATLETALRQAKAMPPAEVEEYNKRLALYRQHQPYRMPK